MTSYGAKLMPRIRDFAARTVGANTENCLRGASFARAAQARPPPALVMASAIGPRARHHVLAFDGATNAR